MKKSYYFNPPRFEYLGTYKLGIRAGKYVASKTEKITKWDWNSLNPIFFIFYDNTEQEYVSFSYNFIALDRDTDGDTDFSMGFAVKFTLNETPINPQTLFKDKTVNKLIKFRPVFETSSEKLDLWVAQYIISIHGDLKRGEYSEAFEIGKKKSGHEPSDTEILGRMNATVEGIFKEFSEPFFEWDFE